MKKVIVFLMILTISSILTSCESTTYCDISYVAKPTFNANIGPIVRSTCAGCHNQNNSPRIPLETYEQVKAAIIDNDLICLIDKPEECFCGKDKIMPQSGRMPDCTVDMFKLWQTQDYPEN